MTHDEINLEELMGFHPLDERVLPNVTVGPENLETTYGETLVMALKLLAISDDAVELGLGSAVVALIEDARTMYGERYEQGWNDAVDSANHEGMPRRKDKKS